MPQHTAVCEWLVDHVGEWLLSNLARGYNSSTLCKEIGMCSSQGCVCGECSKVSEAQGRCLSLPNKCPSPAPIATRQQPFEAKAAVKGEADFCIDGTCDDNHIGCCLTCF